MKQVIYSPDAIEKIQQIGLYVAASHGQERATAVKKKITSRIRSLEKSERQGVPVTGPYGLMTEYRRLYVAPNNIFYRIEGDIIRIIDIYHEKEDFAYKLFGIRSVDENSEAYWDDIEWERNQ